ncbi:MAG: hypothetical protein ACP5O8_00970 [Candidatus Aenigmatarchaeota archaeon]
MPESSDKHYQQKVSRDTWARRKGYESFRAYRQELAKREGLESYYRYLRYTALKKVLKESVGEKFGEDVLNAVLNECKALIVGKELSLPKGANKRAVVAAMVYKVLREKREAVALNEIAELFDTDRWEVAEYFRSFYGMEKIPRPDVKSYIRKYVSNLGLSKEIEESAVQIYEEKKGILRRFSPNSVAATCLYLAAREYGVKESEVAREARRKAQTIRNIMRELKKVAN